MIKRFYLFVSLVLFSVVASAQPVNLPPGTRIAYFTSFEQPAALDCVVLGGVPLWQIDTAYRVPGPVGQAIRGRLTNNGSSWMTTKSFNTTGSFKVLLSFSHIAKLEFQDSAIVQVSVDGGATFINLTGQNCIYLGASSNFRTFNRFNQVSYPNPTDWNSAQLGAIPTNAWFRRELFDITTIASNQADVRVRFRMSDANGNGLGSPAAYGWLVDSILVTTSISELIQPQIAHVPIRGTQFNIDQTFAATINDSAGCDSSGIFSATLFYRVNGGALDSLNFVMSTQSAWSVQLARPRLQDGDTISYFIRAIDASVARNVRYFPESNRSGPGGDSVITYIASTVPTVTHTPFVGQQFSAGPFIVEANVSDASGIDSSILIYRVNQGPWLTKRMAFVSGILYRDTIAVIDGDTVDYYIQAVDSSARRFRRQLPDTAAFWRFIASGAPTVEWPSTSTQCEVFLGAIFNTGPFQIGVRATDGSGIDTVFLYYRRNSGTLDSVGMVRNTVSGAFCNWIGTVPAASDSDTISYYVRAIDASQRRNFNINPSPTNMRQFVALAGIRFPFTDNFDASDVWRGWIATGSATNPTLTPGGWLRGTPAKSIVNNARSAPNAWMPGPINNNYPNNVWYILESPVFDFSQAQNATLSFWQWREISNGGASTAPGIPGTGDGFWIEYTTQVNATVPTWIKLGNAQPNDTNQVNWYNRTNITGLTGATNGAWDGSSNGWERSLRRLIEPAFQGANGAGSIRFRFVFRSNASVQANGVAIDDFSIIMPPQRDLALTTLASNSTSTPITQPNNNFQVIAGDPVVIFARLRNLGLQNIDTIIPVVVEVGSYRDTTFLVPGLIQPNAFTGQSLRLDTIPNAPARWFTVRVYSLWNRDQNRENDTISVQMYGVPLVNVPANDNFDGVDNWLPVLSGTNPNVWERGVPTGSQLNAAVSPPNVWGTVLSGAAPANVSGFLLSPLFNFNNSVNTTLKFRMNRRLGTGGAVRISFVDGLFTNWQQLGLVNDPAGINWYNGSSGVIAGSTGPVWNGQSTNYVEHTLELPSSFNYRSGRGVRFRVEFQNSPVGLNEGVVIDNWEILPPPPREIGITGIFKPVACPDSLIAFDTIRVAIRNFGGDTLFQVPFNFNFNGGPLVLANDFIYQDTIPPAATRIVTLPAFASPQPAANYQLRIFTRLANDARTSNDTVLRCVKSIPTVDLLVTQSLVPPSAICYPSGPRQIRFVVRNIGHTATTTFTAGYILDSLPPVVQTFNRVIAPNAFDTLLITLPLDIPNGNSSLRLFVNNTNDPVRPNDTLRLTVFGRLPVVLTHINNFEGTNPLPYCVFASINAEVDVRDNPTPRSNNQSNKVLYMGAFASGTTFNTTVPANPWVDTWNGPWLSRVALPVETTGRDSIRIRFRLLQLAGSANATDRISLFRVVANGRQIGPTIQPSAATPANNPYIQFDLRLDTVYNPGEPLLIEFQSKCRYRPGITGTSRNGNYVDDIIIYNSMQHGAEVLDVTYSPPFPSQTTPVTVTTRIRNTGNSVLNTVQANLQVNGTTIQTVNAPLNLPFMADSAYSFTTTFNPLLGPNDVCVFTALPNGQPDGYVLDDTLCTEAVGFPVINAFPYCNDFETNLPPWLTRNPVTLRTSGNNFVFGTPAKGFINGAASGNNAWYIGPDSLYSPYDSSAVYTPIFEVNQGECYRVSFKTKYLNDFPFNDTTQIPLAGDGATLEYSTDGGANFTNFGRVDTVGLEWYNNMVFSLRQFNSNPVSLGYGWTGKSDANWMTMRQIFNTTTNNLVLFRFRYGSDDAFQGEGFAFDDFCFEVVPGPCGLVNVQEESLNGFVLRQNYPNPFAGSTTIDYVLPKSGDVKVSVRDLLGRQVFAANQGVQHEGEHSVQVDLHNLEAGVYFYTVSFNGLEQTRKMILSK